MEWFGLTLYGISDPIKDMLRPDYKEPTAPLDLREVISRGSKKPLAELISELDVYLGRTDGYAYKSYDRLSRMRQKGVLKPVGPTDMYRYPGTDAMQFGYWIDDPALKGEQWYKPCTDYPAPISDIGGFLDTALKMDKFFKL